MALKRYGIIFIMTLIAVSGCRDRETQDQQQVDTPNVSLTTTPQPVAQGPAMIELRTSVGSIKIEIYEDKAPLTVENFLRYVNEGFYNGTLFHRVVNDFVIQGGGLTPDMVPKETHAPIPNEAGNGLGNKRGTLAMARTDDPQSATAQFFINLVDNDDLNYIPGRQAGYAVFGRVLEGMEVVDKIARVKTQTQNSYEYVPVTPVVIENVQMVSDQ